MASIIVRASESEDIELVLSGESEETLREFAEKFKQEAHLYPEPTCDDPYEEFQQATLAAIAEVDIDLYARFNRKDGEFVATLPNGISISQKAR